MKIRIEDNNFCEEYETSSMAVFLATEEKGSTKSQTLWKIHRNTETAAILKMLLDGAYEITGELIGMTLKALEENNITKEENHE